MAEQIDAVLDLASALVKNALQLWAGPAADIGGNAVDLIRKRIDDKLQQRRAIRFFDECVDIIADQIRSLLGRDARKLPGYEVTAAIEAVRDTFERSSVAPITVVANDLDALRLERSLQHTQAEILQMASLSAPAERLYRLALRESCSYLVEMVTTLPSFSADSFTEILRRSTGILDTLTEVIERLPIRRGLEDFRTDFFRAVINRFDRLAIFGVTSSTEASRRYPLSVAYISLSASNVPLVKRSSHTSIAREAATLLDATVHPRPNRQAGSWQPSGSISAGRPASQNQGPEFADASIEDALAQGRRFTIVGDAGSGKTTLLQWLAVRSARSDFEGSLSEWNECIPFYVPLRRYADAPMPLPSQFLLATSPYISDEMPRGWVQTALRQGIALVLVDGLDELPQGKRREQARNWLTGLVDQFPGARYLVTSRPAAADESWQALEDFRTVELLPMSMAKVRLFVHHWHEAARSEVNRQDEHSDLDGDQNALLAVLEADRHLRAICINPLLCALICALNRDRRRQLPRNRMGIYAAALEMLVDLRDRERGVPADKLTYGQKVILLQDLAHYLVRNSWSDVADDRARELLGRTLKTLGDVSQTPNQVLHSLLDRTGLIRQPAVGRIDFVHRSFQEYLASKAIVEADDLGFLYHHADDDQFREVIIMAVGHATAKQASELLKGLIDRVEGRLRDKKKLKRMQAMIVASLQVVQQLEPSLRARIEHIAAALVPPESMEVVPALAAVGSLVLDLLVERPPRNAQQARAAIRVASMIGGADGMSAIARFAASYDDVDEELILAWANFEARSYAHDVMQCYHDRQTEHGLPTSIRITELSLVRNLHLLAWPFELTIHTQSLGSFFNVPALPPDIRILRVTGHRARSLDGLDGWCDPTSLDIEIPHAGTPLLPLTRLVHLTTLRLRCSDAGILDVSPLVAIKTLRSLKLDLPRADYILLEPLKSASNLRVVVPRNVRLIGDRNFGPGVSVTTSPDFAR